MLGTQNTARCLKHPPLKCAGASPITLVPQRYGQVAHRRKRVGVFGSQKAAARLKRLLLKRARTR